MIFGEIDSFINLVEKFKKYPIFNKFLRKKKQMQSVSARFLYLFESHGVHRNQIPRFFGHGLTLRDLKDEDSILACLNETILHDACELFAINRKWLDGAEQRVHPLHDFYKHPELISDFIEKLVSANPEGQLDGELFSPEKPDFNSQAIIVLKEIIGFIENEPIYRYHLCNNWSFRYWKARAYLAACVAIAIKKNVYLMGTKGSKKIIQQLADGEVMLSSSKGISSIHGMKWYPEDLVLDPEVFLKDVDPEKDQYGFIAGLRLWSDLETKGFMSFEMKPGARKLFEKELGKLLGK